MKNFNRIPCNYQIIRLLLDGFYQLLLQKKKKKKKKKKDFFIFLCNVWKFWQIINWTLVSAVLDDSILDIFGVVVADKRCI